MNTQTPTTPTSSVASLSTSSLYGRLMTALVVAFLLGIAILPADSTSTPASAAEVRYVCSDTLWVRDSNMVAQWTLRRGERFDIYRGTDNYTVYGYAYGGYNHTGYVYPQYLSTSPNAYC